MILNKEEKKRIVDNLFWMVEDMKHRYDEQKGNVEVQDESAYSNELKEAISLLEDLEKVCPIEMSEEGLNCREFECKNNRQGACALFPRITLASSGALIIGQLKCLEAEGK